MKFLRFAFLLVLLSSPVWATTVTGTIVDPNGNPYANGTVSAQTVAASGQATAYTTPVATNTGGLFTMTLAANTYIFTACAPPVTIGPTGNPTPKQICFSSNPIAISGASQDISATMNTLAAVLGPNFQGSGGIVTIVSQLNSIANLRKGMFAAVTDGTGGTDCTVGGGSTVAICQYNGVSWSSVSGSAAFSAITGGTNTTAPMVVGSGSNLSPSGVGQVAGSQLWLQMGMNPTTPALSFSATGGNLANGSSVFVEYTYVTAAGETTPSLEGAISVSGCTGGNQCSVTVTAPTLNAGYTGYTVYSSVSTTAEKKQAAANNCTNITTNCIIQTVGAGAVPPSTNTAYLQPPNALTSECAPGVLPFLWVQDVNGAYHSWAGVEPFSSGANGPPSPGGTAIFCHRTWFSDSLGSPPGFNNSFVTIAHRSGTGTVKTNQDRALSIITNNGQSDTSQHYSITGIQAEMDVQGNPTMQGSSDGDFAPASFQASDTRTVGTNMTINNQMGIGGLRVSTDHLNNNTYLSGCGFSVATTSAGGGSPCWFGIMAQTYNDGTGPYLNGTPTYVIGSVGVSSIVNNNVLSDTGPQGATAYISRTLGPTHRFGSFNFGYYAQDLGNTASGAIICWPVCDYNFFSDSSATGSGYNVFLGPVGMNQPMFSGLATGQNGGTLLTPHMTVTCITTCTASYTYAIAYEDASGRLSAGSSTVNTGSGATTLNGSNFNHIDFTAANQFVPFGVTCVDFFRTVSTGTPSSTGIIGKICGGALAQFISGGSGLFLNDTGLAGDGTALPTGNQTGGIKAQNFNTLSNCAAVGTAANPSVASCSGASAGSFSCATNASAGTCTVTTTAVTGNSEIFIVQRSDTTTGTRLGVTCNLTVSTVLPEITAVVAGTSFTINLGTFAGNPTCYSYWMVN